MGCRKETSSGTIIETKHSGVSTPGEKELTDFSDEELQEIYVYNEKAAEQGYAEAQYNLGLMYHFGQGVEQDFDQVIVWYQKAVEQGFADAQNNLGLMYHFGQRVEQDLNQALEWFERAAEQGHEGAQDALELRGEILRRESYLLKPAIFFHLYYKNRRRKRRKRDETNRISTDPNDGYEHLGH